MRVALLADIHGNSVALDAVLLDIAAQRGVTEYWILGDVVTLGPDPVGVLERLSPLQNVVYVRGHTDHYVVTEEPPGPSAEQVIHDPSLLPLYAVVAQQIGWTQWAVVAAG